jgi:hypothetical protein
MQLPVQPQYNDFIPRFLHLLFNAGDRVALCSNVGGKWVEEGFYTRDGAVSWLLSNRNMHNLYFRASAFGNGPKSDQDNCAHANAFFLDIDYISEVHKKAPFKSEDDALGYLLTLPLRPSIAWHTGHGVQCAYLLDSPCVFPAGGGTADALDRYRAIAGRLRTMAMGDSAFTPEHAYRVPLTVNSKKHDYPETPDVRGSWLWCDPDTKYSVEQIEAACAGYGIGDLIKADSDPVEAIEEKGDIDCDYDSLPQQLRDEIEETGSERSTRLFSIVGRMVRDGYPDEFIIEAVGHGRDFVNKYGHRDGGLKREIDTCIVKIRQGRYVYGGGKAPPVRVYNIPQSIPLADCAPLPDEMRKMLDRYTDVAGIEIPGRLRNAVQFHEHLFRTHGSCVMESPCGAGKSVWALCHTGAHASAEGDRYIYVTETVDALYNAAHTIESLTDVPVGRIHGFNPVRCHELSGKNCTWRQCARDDARSKCRDCRSRDRCAYFTREAQEKQPVLCMTHEGFIRALEDGSGLLADAHVIVDEGLSPFDTWSAALDDLKRIASLDGVPFDTVKRLFPYTSLAEDIMIKAWGVAGSADVFARRNYVYRNETQTAELGDLISELRSALRIAGKVVLPGTDNCKRYEHIRDTLAGLVNFFRPSAQGDSSYAYRENRDEKGRWRIVCKRSRFGFDTGGGWRSLVMLNASASLSPFPYPDNMPVFTCPDIPENSWLVTLHCIKANPTKAKKEQAVWTGEIAMYLGLHIRRHREVLVCLNRDMASYEDIEKQVKDICGGEAKVTVLTRGRIKGINTAGECTLALLQGMSLFTGIDDCALHAALRYRRTFPDTPYVYTEAGSPNWPGGRMLVPAMRSYYALKSLDEIYQAVWRTAVRNDKPVEAVIVVPDAHWLAALYRTVMPMVCIGSAYAEKESTETIELPGGSVVPASVPTDGTPVYSEDQGDQPDGNDGSGGNEIVIRYNFESDWQLYGMRICAVPEGAVVRKADVAMALGYKGDDPATNKNPESAWKKNKSSIMGLVGDIFEESGARELRRLGRS